MASTVSQSVPTPRILVVGNELGLRKAVSAHLGSTLMAQTQCVTRRDAIDKVRRTPDLNLLFLEMGKGNGEALQTLSQLRALRPALPIVVLASRGDNGRVAEAIRAGAHGYLNMPVEDCELEPVLKRHLSSRSSVMSWTSELAEPLENGQLFICASPSMRKLRQEARVLANIDGPVLILGESGTGKESAARLIHQSSPRADGPFLKVNCVAYAGELLESELFGQERGGVRSRTGKAELCHGGAILLDGIGEMPAGAQAKLLQLLQEGQLIPVGSENSTAIDVRVFALGDMDLPHCVAERRFREDLYYRLSAFTIILPPLRERKEDIPLLLQHFMDRLAAQYHRSVLPISQALIEACKYYTWPGNLRELENFVKRYLIMGDEETALRGLGKLTEGHRLAVAEISPAAEDADTTSLRSLIRSVRGEAEKNAIASALESTKWNRKAAARLLRVSYRSLLYKIEEYHMTPPNGDVAHSYPEPATTGREPDRT